MRLTFAQLLATAVALASAAARPEGLLPTADGNARVSAGADVLSVSELSSPAIFSVSAFATSTTPAPTPTTTAAPKRSGSGSSSSSGGATDEPTPATKTPTPAGSAPSNEPTTPSGGDVTCAFRFSMPTASNLAEELEAAAAAAAAAAATAAKNSDGSTDGSFDGSAASGVNVGSNDNNNNNNGDGDGTATTAGSTGGTTTDAGDAGSAAAKTPMPQAPTPTTKTPLIALKPALTPKPSDDSGSSDSRGRRVRRLKAMQTTADETATGPSETPTPTKTTTASDAPTAAPSNASNSSSLIGSNSSDSTTASPVEPTATTGTFKCDATFYGAWTKLGLKCGEQDLDVAQAVAHTQCLIYSGLQSSGVISNMKLCMSACRFPKCTASGAWDYGADDGFASHVYANLNFVELMRAGGAGSALAGVAAQPFANLTMASDRQCDYEGEDSFNTCKCHNMLTGGPAAGASGAAATLPPSLTVPLDRGLGDSNHWPDGQVKSSLAKVSIASVAIGGSAATVSVAVGGIMSVASGVMGTTSAGVASGISAGASLGVTMAAVDLCQFSIMINQMKLDARPRFLEDMGRRMAPAGYGFLPLWKTANATGNSSSSSNSTTRRLADIPDAGAANQTQGMERYAQLIGVQVDKLFYLTIAGVGALIAALFALYGLLMAVCYPFVSDFRAFASRWLDKAIGVLMMILILSEYVIGVTATFQFCWCIDNDRVDASLVLSILVLLVLAVGTILYGVVVVRNHEDELRDLGTKDHFDKRVHARYGPLYDEYNFEGRFFFAPKLLLALLCGMTTGMIWLDGIWQLVVLIALHIVFLFYLEVKQPYPTQFVQKTSSFVIIIKVSALFLSFFLLSSATSFNDDIPLDLREGVGFAIVGLQVLVLICLMTRQVYIFYRTWKLKKEGGDSTSAGAGGATANGDDDDDDKTVVVTTTNNRDGTTDNFFALGDNQQFHQQQQPKHLRTLQPSRSHTVVVHDEPARTYRGNEVAL